MQEVQILNLEIGNMAIWSFTAYLLIMIIIGVISARFSSKGISNYFVGGRKMNLFVVAISSVVSGRSAWLLLGFSGMAFTMGLSAIWAAVGYIVVEFFLFFSYAPRIRRFSEKHDCITIPDFYASRFGDKDGLLRGLTSFIIIIFMISYVAAQFVAGGKTFASGFGITESQGMLITAVIVLFYTIVGGFLAVSLTDTIQGIFILITLTFLPVIAIYDMGGFVSFCNLAVKLGGGKFMSLFALSAGAFIGFLGIGLGSAGNPHIIVRYISINDPSKFLQVAIIGTIVNIVMALGALATGIAGRLYFSTIDALPGNDPENVFPSLAQAHLNPVFFGIAISTIFAAIMSTADSQLLVAASAVVRDIYQKIVKSNVEIGEKKLVVYSRIVVFVCVVIALILGFYAGKLVFWLVLFAWAGLGASIGTTSILALYWKGTSRKGVIAGLITGTLTVVVWSRVGLLKDLVYELIPAFIIGSLVTIVISILTNKRNDNMKFED